MCSLPVPRAPLSRVAVTGGTHGNEMTGVYLARHWLRAPAELQRPSFSAIPVLANPKAAAACRRYVGRDLNRTFTSTFLTPQVSFTSAATGCVYLSCLELGPQPQGVLRADVFSRMRALVARVLDFIELFNQGTAFPAFEMEAYRNVGAVDFPRTEDGDLAGTVHPQLQDRDFEPLWPGAPIFQMFSGEDLLFEGASTVYPVFINEAAYYEKGTAFLLTEKLTFTVPALPALTPVPTPAS
ncbi:N-acyl-aromatic-L-amino acid amidohydrolase (carboxylate-forming) [Carlito syrichta]|uniref:N-acyl-aromatic-L-amino acid amidohydrolase (Carboxylate-forming) n=1 Tax=Carlito syrichta TaxID=1868482 RepID=A0A3Q0DFD4_CARSF|nr:N-acyl-aromatic-L-amino acid amidohydrolase (carboxylate-forming) [Carlito syrichta]